MVETKEWQGSVVADGVNEAVEEWVVPAGELWLVGGYFGNLLNDVDTALGNKHALTLLVLGSTTGYNMRREVIVEDSLNTTGGSGDNQYRGSVNWYAYPGQTVQLWQSDPENNASELGWVVTMRRID